MSDSHHEDASRELALSTQLLTLASHRRGPTGFLDEALPVVADAVGSRIAAVCRGYRGKWELVAATAKEPEPPWELMAEALDRDRAWAADGWTAAPLREEGVQGQVLVVAGTLPEPPVSTAADQLAAALASVRIRYRQQQRIHRLETILDIATQWQQSQATDDLLQRMAEAATQLLGAERASIFLWDKPNRTLVGRPALGIEEGELRIPDDVGVVGQVVHSGEPRRVDTAEAPAEIDHSVDDELGFETRNLLCVPLQSSSGGFFGAFELINKSAGDFTDDDQAALVELAAHAAVALENTQQYEQLLRVRNQMADQAAAGVRMIGQCAAIDALRSTIGRIADTDLALLILGENGTGKEVVAQLIHYLSGRRNQPLVAVNCAALTETLLESELFGHEKGAFTDAHEARQGKFELASGGTLFLDEIGDMSLSGQAKLLRVLEEKVVIRVGGSKPIHTDARVIAATNQNLAKMVREKTFREDLFFRLNVVTLDLPPLRERDQDVLLLADHFLKDFCVKARRQPPVFTAAAQKRLLSHTWPGNIREVRNLMERLAYLSTGDRIDADELSFILAPDSQASAVMLLDQPLNKATQRFQIEYIQKHIDAARGNMTDAAKRLGLHRSNLYRKMRQLGMSASEAPEDDEMFQDQ